MSKTIYSVTFNPALDISGMVDELIPNEKVYVKNEKVSPGGNGINAGIIASHLGAKVSLTGFLGGPNGKYIKELLIEEKIRNNFIVISGNTRINITVSSQLTHQQTRLSFPGPHIRLKEWKEFCVFLNKLRSAKDIVILGGSLSSGITSEMVHSIVTQLCKRGIYVMVDMPSVSLKKVIKAKPHFIKPNLKEFQEVIGKTPTKVLSVLKAARDLHHLVPLICVSSVEGGALLTSRNEAWFGIPPKLNVKSTVGAGDSMVGAIASAFFHEEDSLEMILRTGLAASCATLTEPGLKLGTAEAIQKFIPKIKIRKL